MIAQWSRFIRTKNISALIYRRYLKILLKVFFRWLCKRRHFKETALAVGVMAWLANIFLLLLLFRTWFVKQQNNWRDGLKVMHDLMAWLTLFSRRNSWNNNIIGVIVWKWCMAWWCDRPLFLGTNREFCLFKFCMMHERWKSKK